MSECAEIYLQGQQSLQVITNHFGERALLEHAHRLMTGPCASKMKLPSCPRGRYRGSPGPR